MTWLIFIMLLLLGLLIMVMIDHINIHITLIRKNEKDKIQFKIKTFFGIIKYKFEVPSLDFKGFNKGVEMKADLNVGDPNQEAPDFKDNVTFKKTIEFFQNLMSLKNHVYNFTDFAADSLSHIKCSNFNWKTNIGIGDAPGTAVSSGIVWSLKSSIAGYLLNKITLETKPHLFVTPQYNRDYFSTELILDLKLRNYYAFTMPIRLFIRVARVRGGLKTWYQILREAYLSWKNHKKQNQVKKPLHT